jgi:putative addiction module component (TIGR02574 family)
MNSIYSREIFMQSDWIINAGGNMSISIQEIDIATLSPIQKMELADVLYDTAQQELEVLTAPLTGEQLREIDRRIAAADGGELAGEPWDAIYERLQRPS